LLLLLLLLLVPPLLLLLLLLPINLHRSSMSYDPNSFNAW